MKSHRYERDAGARYLTDGFYVEGRAFGASLEHASAFAARLVNEYGRAVAVEHALVGGASRVLLYVPADSADALVAHQDAHGHVILC